MGRTELIIQLIKVALGLAIGAYFVPGGAAEAAAAVARLDNLRRRRPT
jgi:hypothetical protein